MTNVRRGRADRLGSAMHTISRSRSPVHGSAFAFALECFGVLVDCCILKLPLCVVELDAGVEDDVEYFFPAAALAAAASARLGITIRYIAVGITIG